MLTLLLYQEHNIINTVIKVKIYISQKLYFTHCNIKSPCSICIVVTVMLCVNIDYHNYSYDMGSASFSPISRTEKDPSFYSKVLVIGFEITQLPRTIINI